MQRTRDFQALLYACTQEGCPLCREVQENTRRYLDAWKYEHFTDVEVREELQRTRGFCHAHTWQLARMSAHIQLAMAYRDIITDAVEQLQRGNGELAASPNGNGLFKRLFETRNGQSPACPACRQQEQSEARLVHTLRGAMADEHFYQQFAASRGLCLDHYRLTCDLKLPNTPATTEWLPLLRQAQLACLQHLDEQLGEMIRKHDYRFKDEARGQEMVSWKRAAGIVAGEEDQL
jgi:hypothetical protein